MKEWLSVEEIADMLGTTPRKVQDAVRYLRRINAVRITPNPRDERYNLIHADGIEAIKKALNLDADTDIA